MRWVVYALLGVNLTVLAWNLNRQAEGEAESPPPPLEAAGNVNRFPLLSELEPGALRTRSSSPAVAARTPVAEPPPPEPGIDAPPDPGADPAPAPTPTPAPVRCFTLGPLPDDAPFARISRWLAERGARAQVHHNERREQVLYWIYFPPHASYAEATARMESLRAEGLDDVIVVRKGDVANAISLGVYSRTAGRDRRLRDLNARGHQPSIAPRYQVTSASWIDVVAGEGGIDHEALRRAFPDYEQVDRPCGGEGQ